MRNKAKENAQLRISRAAKKQKAILDKTHEIDSIAMAFKLQQHNQQRRLEQLAYSYNDT